MSFSWITEKGILGTFYEGDNVSLKIEYETEDDTATLDITSGELPDGLTFAKERQGCYAITGVMPTISDSTIYNFTIRATIKKEVIGTKTENLYAWKSQDDENLRFYSKKEYEVPTAGSTVITSNINNPVYAYDENGNIATYVSQSGYESKVWLQTIMSDGTMVMGYWEDESQAFSVLLFTERDSDSDREYEVPDTKDLLVPEYYDRHFIIVGESYDVEWDTPTVFATTTEYAYLSEYFKLKNPNGNEAFKKISGELPLGITINTFGLCYGTIGEVEESTDYQFRVGVYVDNELKLWKDFIIEVKTLEDLNQPIWITQEGNVGKVNYNEKPVIQLVAYEPSDLPLNYEVVEGTLPYGLELDLSSGTITGIVMTENQSQWDFTVACTNGYKTINRTFNIITNEVIEGDDIDWVTEENLGSVKVGYSFNSQIVATSNYPVSFDIISGKLPDGLKMNKDGEIYGICSHQLLGNYSFTVHAKNIKTETIKTFVIKVEKGLGYNALRAFFYVNLEYQPQFSALKQSFDIEYAYRNYDENFVIPYKPEIYIADLYSYDKPLIQTLLQYNTYLQLEPSETKDKIVTTTIDDKEIGLYDVFYKDFKTTNSSPEEEYVEYKSPKKYIKQKDGQWVDYYTEEPVEITGQIYTEEVVSGYEITFEGETYRVGYIQDGMYYRKDDETVVFGNPQINAELIWNPLTQEYDIEYYYMSEKLERVYLVKNELKRYFDKETQKVLLAIDIDTTIPTEIKETRYFQRDSNVVYVNVPSIETIRHRLEKKIYVSRLTEDVWYDINTEEILAPTYDKPFELQWDEEAQSYWFEMDQMPYVYLACYDPEDSHTDPRAYVRDDDTGEMWQKVYILDDQEFGDIYVNYKHFDVINKETHKPFRNMVFKLPYLDQPFMVDSYGVIRFVNKTNLAQRSWFMFDRTLNDIDSPDLALEYITEEDVNNDGRNYIQFFDSDKEELPVWMDGKYFPKLELFYSELGKNFDNWKNIQSRELSGERLFYKEKLTFYCVTFKPKYNDDLRPFDAFMDYHTNPYTPHTLI